MISGLKQDAPTFLRMIREEPVLKVQYPRYKPYLDTLGSTGKKSPFCGKY